MAILPKGHKFFYQKSSRIYHDPNSKWTEEGRKRAKKLKIKHPLKLEDFGHIVSDTIVRIEDGIKYYFYSAIDAKLKFALTLSCQEANKQEHEGFL